MIEKVEVESEDCLTTLRLSTGVKIIYLLHNMWLLHKLKFINALEIF